MLAWRICDAAQDAKSIIQFLSEAWDDNIRGYLSYFPFHLPNMTLRYYKSMQVTSYTGGKSHFCNTIAGEPSSVAEAWKVAKELEGKDARWWLSPVTESPKSVKILTSATWKAKHQSEALYYNLSHAIDVDVPEDVDLVKCATFADYVELAQNLREALKATMPDLAEDYYNVIPQASTIAPEDRVLEHFFGYKQKRFGAALAVFKSPLSRTAGIYNLLEGLEVPESYNVFDDLVIQVLYQLHQDGYDTALYRIEKRRPLMVKFLTARWMILGPSNTYERQLTF